MADLQTDPSKSKYRSFRTLLCYILCYKERSGEGYYSFFVVIVLLSSIWYTLPESSLEYNRNFFHNLTFLHNILHVFICLSVCVCTFMNFCMPLWILAQRGSLRFTLLIDECQKRWQSLKVAATDFVCGSGGCCGGMFMNNMRKVGGPFESLFFVNVINAFSKFLLLYLFIAACCEVPLMSPWFPP